MFYGMPIHIIRDVALTIRSFYKRITDFLKYRHATRDMNNRYPDATEDDIRSQDVCIICREAMTAWQPGNERATPREQMDDRMEERSRPKKLPCGHILHFACLRSWLERQQNCPTCRQPVLASSPVSPVLPRGPDVRPGNQADGIPGNEPPHGGLQRAGEQNRIRFFNLGPIRLGFGAGQDLQQLEQQIENHQAQQPNRRNGNNPQRFGFGLSLGRQPQPSQSLLPHTPSINIHAQLQAIEHQLIQELNCLRLQADQLHTVRALQGELARLRITQSANAASSTQTTSSSSVHQPVSFPHYPQLQQPFVLSAEVDGAQQNIPSNDARLPPGVTIPEGWTLLPLQPWGGYSSPQATWAPPEPPRSSGFAVSPSQHAGRSYTRNAPQPAHEGPHDSVDNFASGAQSLGDAGPGPIADSNPSTSNQVKHSNLELSQLRSSELDILNVEDSEPRTSEGSVAGKQQRKIKEIAKSATVEDAED